jgi:hypothetical protein
LGLGCVVAHAPAELTVGSSRWARALDAMVVEDSASSRATKGLRDRGHIAVGMAASLHHPTKAAQQSQRSPGSSADHSGRCAGTTRHHAMLLGVSGGPCACTQRTTGDCRAMTTAPPKPRAPPPLNTELASGHATSRSRGRANHPTSLHNFTVLEPASTDGRLERAASPGLGAVADVAHF